MKTIKSKEIQESIERYFDCPYCGSMITNNFGDDFIKDGQGNIICDECKKPIKEVF